jgi:hypothetical protein
MPFIRELLEEAVQEPATVLDPRGRSDLIADVGAHRFVIAYAACVIAKQVEVRLASDPSDRPRMENGIGR